MSSGTVNEPVGLMVIWSSADREVAFSNVFMYSRNALLKGWWNQVQLVVWGPSTKLLAEDRELQQELGELKAAGVRLMACRACALMYGVDERLEELGLEVVFMGAPLTEALKTGWAVLTY